MANVNVQNNNFQKRWDFPGVNVGADWSIMTVGTGMSVSVAGSVMSIVAGTAANSDTIVRCNKAVSLKALVRFIAKLSQRISNQTFSLEIVNQDDTTGAGWRLDGTSATTGKIYSMNNGTANTDVSVTIPTTANYVSFEIIAELEQIVMSAVASNSSSSKTATGMFDRLIPEPDELYYLQIRATNGATAPASSTTFSIDAAYVEDLTMLGVEILRASGDTNPAVALPVRQVGGTIDTLATITTITTAYVSPKTTLYSDTTTALTAGATYTGSSRDAGSPLLYSRFRGISLTNVPGTLYIEQSADNTTWFETNSFPSSMQFDEPILARYVRVRFVNGGVAQASFRIQTGLFGV